MSRHSSILSCTGIALLCLLSPGYGDALAAEPSKANTNKPTAQTDGAKPASKGATQPAKSPEIKQSLASLVTDKPVYYPQCSQTPLRVDTENYQKSYQSLRDLQGVYVNIDDVLKGAGSRNVKLSKDLKEAVIKRLNKAGLRLLSKEEMQLTPGQPEMSMYPSFPKHLGPFKEGEPRPEYNPSCCLAGIWTTFSQGANTLRDPFTRYKLGTWGEGHNTNDCSNIGGWLNEVVLKTIDDFIADKQKGEKEYREQLASGKLKAKPADTQPAAQASTSTSNKPKPSTPQAAPARIANTPAETGHMECNTALMMYIEMFKSGQSDVMPSKYFVLDKLASAMKSCPDYNYIIETHADQRADFSFNEQLTKDRAQAIRQYLNFKGVEEGRFDIQWFGESRPVTMGTTEEDYASNRRVVVTPYRAGKKPKP